jgi:hypothetical protein
MGSFRPVQPVGKTAVKQECERDGTEIGQKTGRDREVSTTGKEQANQT